MKISYVDELRVSRLNNITRTGRGDIIYLMEREQRLDDNWSFIYALELAGELNRRVQVVYAFTGERRKLTLRNLDFIIKGLQEVEARAAELGIVFKVFTGGSPTEAIKSCYGEKGPAAVVCDFNPLRGSLSANMQLSDYLDLPVIEVDSHNIVPCRIASVKQEYGAYTLRKKIEALLPRFLSSFPVIEDVLEDIKYTGCSDYETVDWQFVRTGIEVDQSVQPVKSLIPGYRAGRERLHSFIETKLEAYNADRNDPSRSGQSGLSPYFHFGHTAPQVAALEAAKLIGGLSLKGGFLDEIIVRRELSDNFCLYNPDYDNFAGFPSWAKQSLNLHAFDKREYLYDNYQLETASTHDRLWNAAQTQLIKTGVMHGYMRMYWAKKILEWSAGAAVAMTRAIYLNDKYSLDGTDPNGYAGCGWSIGGLHDRAWADRPVYGKIRYMNYQGCRRKFDTELYINQQETAGK